MQKLLLFALNLLLLLWNQMKIESGNFGYEVRFWSSGLPRKRAGFRSAFDAFRWAVTK